MAGAERLALGGDPTAPLATDDARRAAIAVGGGTLSGGRGFGGARRRLVDTRARIVGVSGLGPGQARRQRSRGGGCRHGALSQRLSEWEHPALVRVTKCAPFDASAPWARVGIR